MKRTKNFVLKLIILIPIPKWKARYLMDGQLDIWILLCKLKFINIMQDYLNTDLIEMLFNLNQNYYAVSKTTYETFQKIRDEVKEAEKLFTEGLTKSKN